MYTIVVGKAGAKLTASEEDPKRDPTMFFYGPGKFVAKNVTIADFAGVLQGGVLDRPVVDQTGLAGRYDFGLVYRPDQPLIGGGAVEITRRPQVTRMPSRISTGPFSNS